MSSQVAGPASEIQRIPSPYRALETLALGTRLALLPGKAGRPAGARTTRRGEMAMPLILWLLGVPLSLIIILWLIGVM